MKLRKRIYIYILVLSLIVIILIESILLIIVFVSRQKTKAEIQDLRHKISKNMNKMELSVQTEKDDDEISKPKQENKSDSDSICSYEGPNPGKEMETQTSFSLAEDQPTKSRKTSKIRPQNMTQAVQTEKDDDEISKQKQENKSERDSICPYEGPNTGKEVETQTSFSLAEDQPAKSCKTSKDHPPNMTQAVQTDIKKKKNPSSLGPVSLDDTNVLTPPPPPIPSLLGSNIPKPQITKQSKIETPSPEQRRNYGFQTIRNHNQDFLNELKIAVEKRNKDKKIR